MTGTNDTRSPRSGRRRDGRDARRARVTGRGTAGVSVAAESTVTPSTGNVFADLGLPGADERLAKADLAIMINRLIAARRLTQADAAQLLGTTQPKVSDLTRGRLGGFSMERLYRFLNALGQDVEIVVRPKPRSRKQARVKVATKSAA